MSVRRKQKILVDVYAALAWQANRCPTRVAKQDAYNWICGIRDHRIPDFCAVHMPKVQQFVDQFCQDTGISN